MMIFLSGLFLGAFIGFFIAALCAAGKRLNEDDDWIEQRAMSGHTPGPWFIKPPWSGFSKISGPDGELIFGLAASDEECDANARLICAAPDMLAALKDALAFIKDEIAYGAGTFDAEARAALSNRIAAVIKQAEGEP